MGYAITGKDLEGLSEDQQAAIMESLLLAVAADRKATADEAKLFEDELNAIPWTLAPDKVMKMVMAARDRVFARKTPAEATSLVQQIGERLTDPSLRTKVYHAVATIMLTDHDITDREQQIMKAYGAAFGLDRGDIEAIEADLGADLPSPS